MDAAAFVESFKDTNPRASFGDRREELDVVIHFIFTFVGIRVSLCLALLLSNVHFGVIAVYNC